LGWESLAGRKLLDFGCGVRFARALVNLGMDIGLYAGVDVHADAVHWLRSHVHDERFRFERIDMKNPLFNPGGAGMAPDALRNMGLTGFDAACMFSVITHQSPDDAQTIFRMLAQCVPSGGSLYFTAFVDEAIAQYSEREPSNPGAWCNYNPEYL